MLANQRELLKGDKCVCVLCFLFLFFLNYHLFCLPAFCLERKKGHGAGWVGRW